MQVTKLQAEIRNSRGTRAARRLRREEKVPGIIYGRGEKPENVAVPIRAFSHLLERGLHVVELDVNGVMKQVLIKDVQFDHVEDKPIHVDFVRITLTERIKVSVPLDFRGTAVGTHEGGLLEHNLLDLEVECLPTEIPASIRVNVGDLNVGDALHVREVELPEGVTAATPADAIVCSVRMKAVVAPEAEAAVAAEGAEAQEPEIIGRKEKEQESEE